MMTSHTNRQPLAAPHNLPSNLATAIEAARAQSVALMQAPSLPGPTGTITDLEFNRIRELIYRAAGISLSESKRALVCSRLAKRLRKFQLKTHTEYLDHLASCDPTGTELQSLINCLTTNKTDFFREPHHFDFLREVVLPHIRWQAERGMPRRLRIWSAGCSRGHEPYSIAITILEHFPSLRGWDVRILASDINTDVLDAARQGIYPIDQIDCVAPAIKHKYFLRGSGSQVDNCQVRPEVQRLVTFRRINLIQQPWPIQTRFDVVFCRNVIIYFDHPTQQTLTTRLADLLSTNGYLILGHSEHPTWLGNVLTARGQTIYQRKRPATHRTQPAGTPPLTPARRLAPLPVGLKKGRPGVAGAPLAEPLVTREITSGQLYAASTPTRIVTTLGSCVAACLFDPKSRIGGMNHFMLPGHDIDPTASARYGVHAMELLINEIMKLGGDPRRLHAKLFGGARLLGLATCAGDIAQRNCDFVRQFLHTERIPIVAQRLGGIQPLRVHFQTDSGKALVKILDPVRQILDREVLYRRRIAQHMSRPRPDSVTLF
jgi:chemotaxis protein methyltransferase CheR